MKPFLFFLTWELLKFLADFCQNMLSNQGSVLDDELDGINPAVLRCFFKAWSNLYRLLYLPKRLYVPETLCYLLDGLNHGHFDAILVPLLQCPRHSHSTHSPPKKKCFIYSISNWMHPTDIFQIFYNMRGILLRQQHIFSKADLNAYLSKENFLQFCRFKARARLCNFRLDTPFYKYPQGT